MGGLNLTAHFHQSQWRKPDGFIDPSFSNQLIGRLEFVFHIHSVRFAFQLPVRILILTLKPIDIAVSGDLVDPLK
jgi:hypothetical protein